MPLGENKQKNKVTKEMNLSEVIKSYPKSAEIMLEYGLHCVGCPAMSFDTIEDAMKIHGLSGKDADEMIKKINETI